MLLCKNRRLFAVAGDKFVRRFSHSHVLVPIPVHFIPIPIPWLILFPFPWESHETHEIPDFPIPMHISNVYTPSRESKSYNKADACTVKARLLHDSRRFAVDTGVTTACPTERCSTFRHQFAKPGEAAVAADPLANRLGVVYMTVQYTAAECLRDYLHD